MEEGLAVGQATGSNGLSSAHSLAGNDLGAHQIGVAGSQASTVLDGDGEVADDRSAERHDPLGGGAYWGSNRGREVQSPVPGVGP